MDCHRRSRSVDNDRIEIRSKSDRRKRYKNEHKHKKSKRRHESEDDCDSYSSFSSYSSSSSRRDRRHRSKKRKRSKDPKRKHHKRKKDKHKRSKKKRTRDRSGSPRRSKSPSVPNNTLSAPPGAHELASALTKLFTRYPSMASIDEGGIALLLIQLGRGTEYNLSHMPDRNLAGLLGDVFMSMRVHGMELSNGAWKWGNAPPANNGISNGDDLALLRLTRALLNGVNLNLDSVKEYEMIQQQQHAAIQQQPRQRSEISQASSNGNSGETKQIPNMEDVKQRKRIERMTSQLLDRFNQSAASSDTKSSSLANELEEICQVILEGESVQLDGIENIKLRASLSQLFQLVGLVLVEIEGDDEVDEEKSAGSSIDMGYALPDNSSNDTIASNLKDVLRVCRFRSSDGKECAPISWVGTSQHVQSQSSDEEIDGPCPLGTVGATAAKRIVQQQTKPHTTSAGLDTGDREEWMMVPGKHDFLKGITKSDFRGRKFKNSKSRSDAPSAAQPINPEVLAEVHAIQQAYQESRGPSLLDAHRQTKAQQQQQDKKKEEWKWSREKNLDDGRRVDKNALQMVLGDASTQLRTKFQSGQK